jgi:hypothetical protein
MEKYAGLLNSVDVELEEVDEQFESELLEKDGALVKDWYERLERMEKGLKEILEVLNK